MNRRDFLALAGTLAAVPFAPRGLVRSGADSADHFVERWSWAMGQPVHLMLFANSEAEGERAAAAALAELRRVERCLSLFDATSDLVALNERAGLGWVRVGEDLRSALAVADGKRMATGGAFNAAVEPLMEAWGFHRPRRSEPAPSELAEAREALRATTLECRGDRLRLAPSGAALDLGGIGVGYGLDRALGVLRGLHIERALLDISGDCAALAPPPGARGWRVDIADPRDDQAVIGTVSLRQAALATSANTKSVIRYGALLRGHILDPATGYPADAVRQATVVAPTGVAADALSTASLVAGRPLPGASRTILA